MMRCSMRPSTIMQNDIGVLCNFSNFRYVVSVRIYKASQIRDDAKDETMRNELKTYAPYLVYAGLSGTEQRFDLLLGN